jgi:hypothetical protein
MAVSKELLRKKAFGIVQSIDAMPEKERTGQPTELFGEDYNKLRKLTAELQPDLVPVLPPSVEIAEYGMGGERFSTQRYSEIRSFCQQIVELLG